MEKNLVLFNYKPMSFFGGYVGVVFLISLFIGYKIFLKILRAKNHTSKKSGFLENLFLILMISIIMILINAMTFVTSYSFFWEKAYRSLNEHSYEATVIGYKKEISKTQNFRNSTYYDTFIFFPKVKYQNDDGDVVIKTLDITSRKPFKIGAKVKITDDSRNEKANTISLNWGIFTLGTLFTGISAFFSTLLSTYMTNDSLKRRVKTSVYFGFFFLLINMFCVILLYIK